ncbi:MAG: DNA-binding protein [Campylobacteraceae bacterium 4484_4]|nr:MAG: DNA-binding protein [Campylobacteraceae bacterium 4484_4]
MKKIFFLMLAGAISLFALDINTATKADFVKVKGIGEKKAENIIAYREAHGKFASLEELKKVKGIGDKIINELKAEEAGK